jgi:hypothetical protein
VSSQLAGLLLQYPFRPWMPLQAATSTAELYCLLPLRMYVLSLNPPPLYERKLSQPLKETTKRLNLESDRDYAKKTETNTYLANIVLKCITTK